MVQHGLSSSVLLVRGLGTARFMVDSKPRDSCSIPGRQTTFIRPCSLIIFSVHVRTNNIDTPSILYICKYRRKSRQYFFVNLIYICIVYIHTSMHY